MPVEVAVGRLDDTIESNPEVFLRGRRIDTLLLAGSSMSGCDRATAVEGSSRDCRVMLVRERVVDRTQELVDRNLFDLDAKDADALSLDETLDHVEAIDARSAATADRRATDA